MTSKGSNFKKLLLAGVAATGMAFAVADAQAALITAVGGAAGSTPAINDVFGIRAGIFGANLTLDVASTATVELIGYEAGATNTFNINGGAIEFSVTGQAGTIGSPVGPSLNFSLAPGLLNFVFTTTIAGGSVANGANVLPTADAANFFVSFGAAGGTDTSGTVVLIALDDNGGGVVSDDNHDDLVIRITLTPVPEPATLALFGMGLLGLGIASRRRKA